MAETVGFPGDRLIAAIDALEQRMATTIPPLTAELTALNKTLAGADLQTILHDLALLLKWFIPAKVLGERQMVMTATQQEHHSIVHAAVGAGIPWSTIFSWLIQFGIAAWPIILQVLQIVVPLILGGKLSLSAAITYAEQYIAAVLLGQPAPPPPA